MRETCIRKKVATPSIMGVFMCLAGLTVATVCIFQAIMGQAVDRHLLGLRMLAGEAGMEVPEIFTDTAYSRSSHFCLSTSQVCVQHSV